MMGLGCVALKPKARLRADLAQMIADFVARGGRITRCPGFGEGPIERDDPRVRAHCDLVRGQIEGGKAGKRARSRMRQYEMRSTFDFEARREIRARFLEGETPSELGRAFHCDPARIKAVLDEAHLREARI